MPDCLFCSIASKKIPGLIITENTSSVAFLDIHPLSQGHTIVIPKNHTQRIIELKEADAGALFLTVKQVSDTIHASLRPDGFTIGINDGPGGGQGVPHLHIHIIPRYSGDGGGNLHSIVHNPPTRTVEEVFKKITT